VLRFPDLHASSADPGPPHTATLARAQHLALDHGIRYAYTGNTHDTAGQSTYCHHCGELVIERDWYRLGGYRLTPEGAWVRLAQSALSNLVTIKAGRPGPGRLSDFGSRMGAARLGQAASDTVIVAARRSLTWAKAVTLAVWPVVR